MKVKEIPSIKTSVPGPKSASIIEEAKKYLVTTTRFSYIVIAKMENDLIFDVDGNVYIDLAAGIAVANIGHRNPEVLAAVKAQLEKYIHTGPHDWFDEIQLEYAKKLVKYIPGQFDKKVFYANSGTESVEAAIKIARWNKKRPLILAFYGAFHGRSLGSLTLTASKKAHRRYFYPYYLSVHAPYAYCYRCPFKLDPSNCNAYCADFIEEWIFEKVAPPEDIAAIIAEPIQGEGGYVVPHPLFIEKIAKMAKKYDMLFIVDEVQTGFARTGKMFSIEHFNAVQDIITVAKSIANGFPLGATVIRSDLDFGYEGAHSSTFGGNAVSLAAANATLDYIIKHRLWERAAKLGDQALKIFNELKDETEILGDVRGKGLFIGLEFVKNKDTKEYGTEERDKITELAYKKGLVVLPAGRSVLRLAPPLTITDENWNYALNILVEIIKEVDKKRT
ncbi:MAG: acetyl ornithine aminotransferase family protein [Crenarchaeota archaeon]|nr:acetyl ornithine aminotransferase family protein [Thermoproteota archaeon]MCR8454820.1 acetyl ornithine aminotransferase family protein [Thermoproteota archaeon]MCR8470331.1 acetyl ornithine aminotransferase family protein [Thermoproteota archaeon]MCR8471677.1 acetyl ornithine aminotransferase family protein [Thermoproteota archaeon]MCR8472669.1 acetyl ornithine aminotransferase family protein [Thermoproteota archaeon]